MDDMLDDFYDLQYNNPNLLFKFTPKYKIDNIKKKKKYLGPSIFNILRKKLLQLLKI